MKLMLDCKNKPCPKCGGDVNLYPECYAREDGNNRFAYCNKCHVEFLVPALLVEEVIRSNGLIVRVRHTSKSVKEAQKAWNKSSSIIVREHKSI